MRLMRSVALSLLIAAGWVGVAGAVSPARIEFELVTESGFPLTGARQWLQLFESYEQIRVRIRGARNGERESVRNVGDQRSPSYHVVGVLSNRNRLKLPGQREFSHTQRGQLTKWIEDLRREGMVRLTGDHVAFGLTSDELMAFHQRHAAALDFNTRDQRAGDVARTIVKLMAVDHEVTAAARRAFARNEAVADELNGLSQGTALAAVLRPLGLGAAPRKRGGEVELLIAETAELEEWWPIGWPSQASPFKAAPPLFEYLNVAISEVTLQRALDAIQPRVKVPFLFDHNALARHRIDIAATVVSFPERRSFYMKIIENLLFQAGLKSELRMDDAGTPFLWITSRKP